MHWVGDGAACAEAGASVGPPGKQRAVVAQVLSNLSR